MKKLLPTLALCVSLVCAVHAFADQIIELPADPGQGNYYPFGGYSGRYQQVYTSKAFSGAITISALEFFNTQGNSGATSTPSGTWTIALSTTSADWNTLSTNFSANVGGNNTVVFSGNLFQPWRFGNTLRINLSTPFTYLPRLGNLLMDVIAAGVTRPGGFIYFDTTGYNGGAENGSTLVGHVDVDGVRSGYGLVTGFVGPTIAGGGDVALLTFVGLLAAWIMLCIHRSRRSVSR